MRTDDRAALALRAQLPELALREGSRVVARITLRLDPQAAPVPTPLPPRLVVEEPPRRRGADEQSATVALAFDSAVLGRLDLRVDLARGNVSVSVGAPAGATFELAEGAARRLQEALAARTGRAAQVRVTARRDPFDAYA